MGLDMYLTKKTYIWSSHLKKGETAPHEIKITDPQYSHIKPSRIKGITEEVGYWRKANQIHKWFVDNVQGGNDDCKEYEVSEENLNELLQICKKIVKECTLTPGKVANGYTITKTGNKKPILEDGNLMQNSHIAAKLLPTASGFFFGGTDYDEYYMNDITGTIEIIESLLAEKNGKDYLPGDIYYQSSW